jgi:hypothetical protein
MKMLGFVFLCVLLLATVGYFRGWFSISTSHASGKSGLELTIDNDKLGEDAKSVTKSLPTATAKVGDAAAEAENHAVDAVLAGVDVAARNLTVTIGTQTLVQHVATAVAITRSGASIGLDALVVGMRAKLIFDHATEPRVLLRIEILR